MFLFVILLDIHAVPAVGFTSTYTICAYALSCMIWTHSMCIFVCTWSYEISEEGFHFLSSQLCLSH